MVCVGSLSGKDFNELLDELGLARALHFVALVLDQLLQLGCPVLLVESLLQVAARCHQGLQIYLILTLLCAAAILFLLAFALVWLVAGLVGLLLCWLLLVLVRQWCCWWWWWWLLRGWLSRLAGVFCLEGPFRQRGFFVGDFGLKELLLVGGRGFREVIVVMVVVDMLRRGA